MLIKPYHTFRHDDDDICLINPEKMTAINIDESTAALLELVPKDLGSAAIPEAESALEKLGLIDKEERLGREKTSAKAASVVNIALLVTQQCNLRCIYCYGNGGGYGSGGEMNRKTAYRAVDWLIEQSKDIRKLGITFFGGEPLLNFSLMKEVVHYALKRGNESGKEFEFNITTNASLLDDEKIVFFKEYKINPLVSFDGPKEIQDTQRPFKNGKGSYELTLSKIKQLLEGLPKSACRAIIVGATSPVVVDNALREIGFGARHLGLVSPSLFGEENDSHVAERDFTEMLSWAQAMSRELRAGIKERDTERLNNLKGSGTLGGFVEQFVNSQKRYFPCSAGRDFVGVSCSGNIYLCHRFVGIEGQRLGDIYNGDLKREIYQVSPLRSREKCANCFAKYLCGGGCYHDNLGTTGSVFEADEGLCAHIRRLTELAAAICCRLSEDDKAYLVKEKIISKKLCPLDLF